MLFIVALAAGFFNSLYAQDTVPKEPVQGFNNARITGTSSSTVCRTGSGPTFYGPWVGNEHSQVLSLLVDSLNQNSTSYTYTVGTEVYDCGGGSNAKILTILVDGGTRYETVYFVDPVSFSQCPETHPVDNGDGTCSKTEEQKECEKIAGNRFSETTSLNSSGYSCISGCVAKQNVDGMALRFASTPEGQWFQTVEYTGAACDGSPDGANVDQNGNEVPPEEEQEETPDSCAVRAANACASTGEFAAGVGVVNGQCSYSCTAQSITEDNFNDPHGDHDGDGISNINDPDHPINGDPENEDDWGETNPNGDTDGDGIPNIEDPDHPLNQDDDGDGIPNGEDPDNNGVGGGWGSGHGVGQSGTDNTGVEARLDRLIAASVANNEDNKATQEILGKGLALTEQFRAENKENLEKLREGLGADLTDEELKDMVKNGFMNGYNGLSPEEQESFISDLRQAAGLTDATGAEIIPVHTINANDYDDDYGGFVSAPDTCPSPIEINLFGNTYQFEYDALCEVLEAIKPLLIMIAYISAAFIIFMRGSNE